MTPPNPARRRFLAAMALYLAWVGVLATMAIMSSNRPPSHRFQAAVGESPTRGPSGP